jgi:hypothetical protein
MLRALGWVGYLSDRPSISTIDIANILSRSSPGSACTMRSILGGVTKRSEESSGRSARAMPAKLMEAVRDITTP